MSDVEEITTGAAAERLGYTPRHVRRLLRAGKLAGRKLDRVWSVALESVERYLLVRDNYSLPLTEPEPAVHEPLSLYEPRGRERTADGVTVDGAGRAPPIACTLSAEQLEARLDSRELRDLTAAAQVSELPDGIELEFSGDDAHLTGIVEFVAYERRCCQFLTFEIVLEPGLGPIHLRIRGPAGTKEFLTALLPQPGDDD